MTLVTAEPIWRPELQQRRFRAVLEAMSYPGRVLDLSDTLAGGEAELGVLACLVDEAVTYADPDTRLDARQRSLLGSVCLPAEEADYVLHSAAVPPLADYRPRLGDLYRPDASATLILSGTAVGSGSLTLRLQGPGIESETKLHLDGFAADWFERRAQWVANFPRGVDLLLCDATRVAALPRTTHVAW
jgi:alpha-D-ribose 1-methylphosphonate 5-triphosphate synthase subunit PhnH